MTHQVHLQGVPRQHAAGLRRAVIHTLKLAEAAPGSLTVRLTDEAELRRLNAAFADAHHSTDVLAFPDGDLELEGLGIYFGDVVIARPIAEAQAMAAGHDVQSELLLLAVHGTLHLLGYDHATEQERGAMWQRQDRILEDIGCPIRSPQGEA